MRVAFLWPSKQKNVAVDLKFPQTTIKDLKEQLKKQHGIDLPAATKIYVDNKERKDDYDLMPGETAVAQDLSQGPGQSGESGTDSGKGSGKPKLVVATDPIGSGE